MLLRRAKALWMFVCDVSLVLCCGHVKLMFNVSCCSVCLCAALRLLQGVGRPDEVLACVEAGVDLFVGFFPFQVTERGCALCFDFDISTDPERAGRAAPAGVVKSCIVTLAVEAASLLH